MAKTGPIIVVEDDEDDVIFLKDILKQLEVSNSLIWFTNSADALNYLRSTNEKPFFILSDVNLPVQNGIEFKRQIDVDPQLRKRSIPFVFYSTSVAQVYVDEAYSEMSVQGFFQKGNDFREIQQTIQTLINYWMLSKHPTL
jgi:CheY-like chemotaxis protein